MYNSITPHNVFEESLKLLGFFKDDALYIIEDSLENTDWEIKFQLEKAKTFGTHAVYFRKQFNGSYKPQVYIFDYTNSSFSKNQEDDIYLAQKRIWSNGEVPLACFFFDTEIKIIDCTKADDKSKDTSLKFLAELNLADKAHKLYNENFAVKIKTGVFWDELENKNKFKFSNSAYEILIDWIKKVTKVLIEQHPSINKSIINKIIIQAILIKYLEEKKDENQQNLFGYKYFPQFDNSHSFVEVLRKGLFVELLTRLNIDFNGNIFAWEEFEKDIIRDCNLNLLANALEGNSYVSGQQVFEFIKLYDFNYIPVELISRIYEEFLAGNSDIEDTKKNKQKDGIYYTPAHLARLLVDESMPLKDYNKIDFDTYKILDPACGSGIFLVSAFKRLVQWWRLQNGLDKPREVGDLKNLLKCLYGTDKEEQATRLAAFSLCLALCDELSPKQIITDLRFDDLTKSNILYTDFFIKELAPEKTQNYDRQLSNFNNIERNKYSLIIGNPPFNRGAISDYKNTWEYDGQKVNIPQGQIALKFLSESLPFLKENGIQCLIIKSSGLLYNSSSKDYKQLLFSKLNVVQVFDFTALAEGKSLWDNGARVGSAAIFLRNSTPDYKRNILHVTFRRTKATKERLVFEIDDYDLHYINRHDAITCDHIWKTNLLGGGRTQALLNKFNKEQSFSQFCERNDCIIDEGFEIGTNGRKKYDYIYELPFLPTEAISEDNIEFSKLTYINKNLGFNKLSENSSIFLSPNLIIWESIGENRFPIFLNTISFSFKRRIIGIKSRKDNIVLLQEIKKSFDSNYITYKFLLLSTSGETLINRNNTFLLKDLKSLPFISDTILLSTQDTNIIYDVVHVYSNYLIYGENSIVLNAINKGNINEFISVYGLEFSSTLNSIYETNERKFRLDEIVLLDDSRFIATVFKYDSDFDQEVKISEHDELTLSGLSQHEISRHLTSNRIIKLYPQKDTIVFIKPNQYRYWISLIAYRDADKCIADLAKAGY